MKLPQISKVTVGVVLGLGMLAASSQSQAALLGVNLQQPDILSSFIDFNYDATTDSLTGTGFALQLANGGLNSIVNGSFNLSATVDDTGALSGGTVSITGTIGSLGFSTGTLLTGNLTGFGFDATGGALDFLFTVTGGEAATLYGANGGIIIGDSGFSGDFVSNWNNTGGHPTFGAGQADVGAVPVPAAAWLFGSGLLGLAGAARRSSKKQA